MSSSSELYFASVAGKWDEMRTEYFTEHMRDAAIERARLPHNAIVADIGTGTGFVAAGLRAAWAGSMASMPARRCLKLPRRIWLRSHISS